MASDCFEMKASKKDERYEAAKAVLDDRKRVDYEIVVTVDGKPVKTVRGKTVSGDTFPDL